MSGKANAQRPGELRRAIVEYLTQNGLADLSLRPLAKAVGSSPRVLLYYFGSKENMVIEVLAEVRRQQLSGFGQIEGESFAEVCTLVWKKMSAADSEPYFRLFFEAYGMALRRPRLYRAFLHSTVGEWLRLIADPLRSEGVSPEKARAFATVLIAGLRGFMLDYCNTRDRKRIDYAVRLWAATLDDMLAACRKG
jgi:AcrR family transcriptional regulator